MALHLHLLVNNQITTSAHCIVDRYVKRAKDVPFKVRLATAALVAQGQPIPATYMDFPGLENGPDF